MSGLQRQKESNESSWSNYKVIGITTAVGIGIGAVLYYFLAPSEPQLAGVQPNPPQTLDAEKARELFWNSVRSSEDCTICSKSFSLNMGGSEMKFTMLNCRHLFHSHCIGEWLKHVSKPICPVCRVEIRMQ